MVIPVRYVARGYVVHATSTAISADDVHVRSAIGLQHGLSIGLKLYFPDGGGIVCRSAIVAEASGNEFRAEFNDHDDIGRQRISELLWRREIGIRPYPRFHAHLRAALRERGRPTARAYVTNISRSGAFVRLESLPARGSVVELDLALPGQPAPETVHAYVVHVAPHRGVGVQFIGADDAFSSHLEEYLTQLARQEE
jgi:hypothetical protein